MKKILLIPIGLALAAFVLAPSSLKATEAASKAQACSGKGGTCGCSAGTVVCCDGSYAPKYTWAGGRMVTHECASVSNRSSSQQVRQRHPTPLPDVTRPGLIPPSHENFWKRSVFDR